MKKPNALISLLEELQGENVVSDVVTTSTSKASLFLKEDALDDDDAVTLSAEDCKLIFANLETVERLIEALEEPDYISVCLHDLRIDAKVLDFLERKFVAVDEI